MKKILFACLLLAGCSSPQNEIIAKGETYLKENLKDPSSYEKIESTIIDTTTYTAYFTLWSKLDSLEYEAAKLSGSEAAVRIRKETYDVTKKQLADAKPGEIRHIQIYYKYRAKNGFGALDIHEQKLLYFPSTQKFEVGKN